MPKPIFSITMSMIHPTVKQQQIAMRVRGKEFLVAEVRQPNDLQHVLIREIRDA